MRTLFVLVLALAAISAFGEMSQTEAEVSLVKAINTAGAELRRTRTTAKWQKCKEIYQSKKAQLTLLTKIVQKFSEYLPENLRPKANGQGTVSLFLQAEASAKAFVGISGGIGVGVDLTFGKDTNGMFGSFRLFACVSAGVSMGFTGASASVGAGALVGFGRFDDSIGRANLEIGGEVSAVGSVSVAVCLEVPVKDKGIETFKKKWEELKNKETTGVTDQKTKFQKLVAVLKRIAKSLGAGFVDTVKGTRVRGIHVSGGVGVGGGGGVSVDISLDDVADKIKEEVVKMWQAHKGGLINTWQKVKGLFNKVTGSKKGKGEAPQKPKLQRANAQQNLLKPKN